MDKELVKIEVRHVSYSAFQDLLKCGKAYELRRGMSLPGRPSWWLAGGSALHAATEEYDRTLYALLGA